MSLVVVYSEQYSEVPRTAVNALGRITSRNALDRCTAVIEYSPALLHPTQGAVPLTAVCSPALLHPFQGAVPLRLHWINCTRDCPYPT